MPFFHNRSLLLRVVIIPRVAGGEIVTSSKGIRPDAADLHSKSVPVLPDMRHLMDQEIADIAVVRGPRFQGHVGAGVVTNIDLELHVGHLRIIPRAPIGPGTVAHTKPIANTDYSRRRQRVPKYAVNE